MNLQLKALVVALACATGGAMAADQTVAPSRADEAAALAAAGESGPFLAGVRAQQALLARERAFFPRLFQIAYARYPRIPAGTLEALAYAQSAWHHLRPDRTGDLHDPHMPPAWGVMGLYNGDGFDDQVGEAAALLGTSARRVREDPLTNILAAAALLDRQLRGTTSTARSAADPSTLAQALQRYAGFGSTGGQIDAFSRAVFARDVLQALDTGVDDNGIQVPERAVEWERVFPADMLVKLQAPLVRLDASSNEVRTAMETEYFKVDPVTEQLVGTTATAAAVDFPSASWDPSPNYNSRSGTAVREVIQHTTEGSFSGAISWFKNPASDVSAHYVLSSSGQVVQMVRESNRAWHAGNHNSHAIGIEHAGYANNPSTWTSAIVNKSAAITRSICARYAGVTCTNAVKVNASPTADVAESIAIKGHGMISGASRYDPGKYFNWVNYYALINGGTPPPTGTTTVLDSFESSVGRFGTSPTYSGSTTGISTASTSARNCTTSYSGSCSLNVKLVDNPSSSANWEVRLLSGAGNPGSNSGIGRNSQVGFWVLSGGSGMSVGITVDDGAGTERSIPVAIPANKWTYVAWNLNNAANFNAWAGSSNGSIDAATVTLDAIWFYRAQTSYNVQMYVDNVQVKKL